MRQLSINEWVESCALLYLRRLNRQKIRNSAFQKLNELKQKYSGAHTIELFGHKSNNVVTSYPATIFVDYINTVIKRYDSLRIMHPHTFYKEIQRFESIIPRDHVRLKMKIDGGDKKDSLANEIVSAMQYQEVRNQVYPGIARLLGLKTCVYCNANYTITDKNGFGYFDLDHWKPKSKYPYLCTSFYNLQPACPSCNRNKADNDGPFFCLWDDCNRKHRDVIGVNLRRKSIIKYILSHDRNELFFSLFPYESRYQDVRNNMQDTLHIEERYIEHADVAEEIIWKSQIYRDSYLSTLKKMLSKQSLSDGEIGRFILGAYVAPEDIHKRPLSSMINSVSWQLGLQFKKR